MCPVRALVTGSAGFVGRHMVAELVARGWDVAGVDLRQWSPVAPPTAAGAGRYAHATGDMLDGVRLPGVDTFDLVAHCAYHVGGRAGIDGEPRNLAHNLQLDAAMFEWAVRTGQRRVLYFSSSAAYPTVLQTGHPPRQLAEDDLDLWGVRPDARYGWAKVTGEHLAQAAAESGLPVHVVRPFSGYGENQDDCYPFPAIVRRALAGDFTVWGPPGQCRDWIHISDVVRGALAVVDADERRPVNLCSGSPVEFGVLALRVAELAALVSPDRPWPDVEYREDRPTGVMYRVGDPARMREHYTPAVPLDEGIRRAIEHVRGGPA